MILYQYLLIQTQKANITLKVSDPLPASGILSFVQFCNIETGLSETYVALFFPGDQPYVSVILDDDDDDEITDDDDDYNSDADDVIWNYSVNICSLFLFKV